MLKVATLPFAIALRATLSGDIALFPRENAIATPEMLMAVAAAEAAL